MLAISAYAAVSSPRTLNIEHNRSVTVISEVNSANNFTFSENGDNRGAEMCKAAGYDGVNNTCYPIFNNNDSAINLRFPDLSPGVTYTIQPRLVGLAFINNERIDSTKIIIYNTGTGKQIYDNQIQNMKGLACGETSCK